MSNIRRIRDLSLIDLPGEVVMVISCDSLGGIGAKELDVIKVSGYFVGRVTARVSLMEIMATGAEPTAFFNTLAVEMAPSGQEIIRGMAYELALAGIDPDLALNGSTEENVPTLQTGVGMVALGLVPEKRLLLGKTQKEDVLVVFGKPKVGAEVMVGGPDDPEVAKPSLIRQLLKWRNVHELLPVGSKGILYECWELAKTVNLHFQLDQDVTLDVKKSAGPATCLLASISPDALSLLKKESWQIPWQIMGKFY